jgi:CubicO group peptidase (beta-lactamase class C family)
VSISKTFTAAAVLVLAARGALALDDDVCRHLPELPRDPRGGGPVTIRHLLSMTSGLRDVLEIERLRGVWHASASRPADLLDLAYRQAEPSAPPGAQYMYANVNFVLLEEVVRRASGMPAESFRRAVLYEPLGLAATAARPHDGLAVADLAQPYVADGDGWARATHLLGIAADPLVTTLEDLTRWVLALRAGSIGGVAVTAAMAAPARLRDGRAVYYGLGLAVRRYRGLTVLCHTGSQPGYKAHVAYVPARDLGLAILSNREDARPTDLASAIMERVIGGDFPEPHPAVEAARRRGGGAIGSARALEGAYVDPESGEWVALAVEDGVLRGDTLGDPFFLYPGDDGLFCDGADYRATVPVELGVVAGAGVGEATCRLDLGGQQMRLLRCDPPRLPPEALAAFAGRYESAEIASRHLVRVQGDRLAIDYGLGHDAGLAFAMEPLVPDTFLVRPTAPGISHRHVFRFERNRAGVVIGAMVTMERLKRVRLARVGPLAVDTTPAEE